MQVSHFGAIYNLGAAHAEMERGHTLQLWQQADGATEQLEKDLQEGIQQKSTASWP